MIDFGKFVSIVYKVISYTFTVPSIFLIFSVQLIFAFVLSNNAVLNTLKQLINFYLGVFLI